NDLAGDAAAERLDDPSRHGALAPLIAFAGGPGDGKPYAVDIGHAQERHQVFWKARAAEARAGMEEFRADAVVEAHAAGDVLDVGAGLFAQVGHLVDEGDLGREKRVR